MRSNGERSQMKKKCWNGGRKKMARKKQAKEVWRGQKLKYGWETSKCAYIHAVYFVSATKTH